VLTTTASTGSQMPLTPTTPFKLPTSGTCTTRNSCDVPNMTKTMALPMTFMLSRNSCPVSKPESSQQLSNILTTSPDDQIPQGLQAGY
jgi:hypothetical protein